MKRRANGVEVFIQGDEVLLQFKRRDGQTVAHIAMDVYALARFSGEMGKALKANIEHAKWVEQHVEETYHKENN